MNVTIGCKLMEIWSASEKPDPSSGDRPPCSYPLIYTLTSSLIYDPTPLQVINPPVAVPIYVPLYLHIQLLYILSLLSVCFISLITLSSTYTLTTLQALPDCVYVPSHLALPPPPLNP